MMHQPISQVSLSSTSSIISSEKSAQEKAERNEKYAALAARKEALERQVREKNEDLKRLCVQEAELTGSLPLETPLEPGELPPAFRRRIGTAFTIPDNLFSDNHLKSQEDQTLAALELEYKILSQITSAAMRMASDVSLKRAVRRQRRIEYQQNSKRLTAIEHRLNEARKNQALKLRKKPRPSSEIVGSESSAADKEPSEGGFGMPNLTKSVALGGSGRSFTSERPPTSSSSSSSLGHNFVYHNHMHDSTAHKQQEKLHGTLSAPHQYLKSGSPDFRGHRQQLQRLSSGGYIPHNHHTLYHQSHSSSPTNNFTTPIGTELERLSRHDTGFLMSPSWSPFAPHDITYLHHHSHTARPAASQNFLEMDDNEPLDGSPSRRPSLESRSRWKQNRFGSLDRKKKMAQSSPCLDSRSVEGLDILQPDGMDVPDRADFIIPTTRPSHKTTPSKRAETKQLPQQHHHHHPHSHHQHHRHKSGTPPVPKEPSWQMTPPPRPRSKDPPPPPPPPTSEALLPGQTYPEHSYAQPLLEKVRLSSGGLIRTQSLGSVGTSSSSKSASAAETRSIKDMYPSGTSDTRSMKDMYPSDTRSIKDMYPSTSYTQQLPPKRHPPPLPPEKPPSRRPSGHSGYEVSDALAVLHLSGQMSETPTAPLSPQGSIGSQTKIEVHSVAGEAYEVAVPVESPKNHTVIQAGKWQPYWEESKPFEMSDFYKYSTKFRNKAKDVSKQQPLHLRVDDEAPTVQVCKASPTPSMSPQQKGVYQPLQPMTCQAIDPNAAKSPELPAKQGKVMSPNMSLNMSNGGESLADAFSSEMLAWYQDKSVPRSATLV